MAKIVDGRPIARGGLGKHIVTVFAISDITANLLAEPVVVVTLIANRDTETRQVVERYKAPFSNDVSEKELPGLAWPPDVFSLSHVALPIPPEDPLYGSNPPEGDDSLHLGDIPMRGERGLQIIPGNWLLRMRYNPFYEVLETRILAWHKYTESLTTPE